MYYPASTTWGDLTPARQVEECESAAIALEATRPSSGYAGNPVGLAAFYRRLAAEIRVDAGLPVPV